MNMGGIFSEQEVVNFILDKVRELYVRQYVNHVSLTANSRRAQHTIVPDLHAHNFLAGIQRVDDSRAHQTAEAFFEMKTYMACNRR